MFTGLIEEVGIITRVERRGESAHFSIRASKALTDIRLGESIAVSGACLTVVRLRGEEFVVDAMPETISRSTLSKATAGTLVNLERSLALGGRLDGHFVLGHVDAVATVVSVRPDGIAWKVAISIPESINECVACKGSIAIDGISLTIMEVENGVFTVGIIPHTLKETTLSQVKAGMQVNLEIDVLARYVFGILKTMMHGKKESGNSTSSLFKSQEGVTEQFLRDQGFV